VPDISEDWVREQFQIAKVKVGSGTAVLKLLDAWRAITISEKMGREAVEIFSKVALGHSILPETPGEVWGPAQPGFIQVADEVRVMADAFDGALGQLHNGRRGKVVAVRHGDVIFNSTDGIEPKLDSAHYSPYKLEKRYQ
jgi:hypothetical protein